jgi:hypothetical protein
MIRFVLSAAVAAAVLLLAHPAPADSSEFRRIATEGEFASTVVGRSLTRMGIRLNVTDAGVINGRAFGQAVSGEWSWQSGLFCRSLYFGRNDLGYNCQVVLMNGDTVRFVSDSGQGDFADLRLR